MELAGAWLARAHAAYGMFLLVTTFVFVNLGALGAVILTVAAHARGGTPWPWVPAGVRRWLRLAVEVAFGLVNPVLYLSILQPSIPELRASAGDWYLPLSGAAWVLLALFWSVRVVGSAVGARAGASRGGVRLLLGAVFVCLLAFIVKDALLMPGAAPSGRWSPALALAVLRICPLYLIPAVLLWEYLRSAPPGSDHRAYAPGLFLLPGRSARAVVATVAVAAIFVVAATTYRRSDASVRRLVAGHRESIRAAADRYGVDLRLIASIVYVTHRDQLSPFRDSLERMVVSAWARNMRGELGLGSPDQVARMGTDENPLLNRAFDVSVGLAQIKPRTAQSASVLATGLAPDDLPRPVRDAYRDVEPLGPGWVPRSAVPRVLPAPIPVPAARHVVAAALLDDRSNVAMCALILALYQEQWEAANPAWSLRARPEILATLYQLGFARSRPHAAPRSNAFGTRVREVSEQPWLDGLLQGRLESPER